VPTEYDYYYYEPQRYVEAVARAGASRGAGRAAAELRAARRHREGVRRGATSTNAWHAYLTQMRIRRESYMRTDMAGEAMPIGGPASGRGRCDRRRCHRLRRGVTWGPAGGGADRPGGYEGVAPGP